MIAILGGDDDGCSYSVDGDTTVFQLEGADSNDFGVLLNPANISHTGIMSPRTAKAFGDQFFSDSSPQRTFPAVSGIIGKDASAGKISSLFSYKPLTNARFMFRRC